MQTTVQRPAAEDLISVSVIIPVLNEERMIGRCLASLSSLAFPHHFEVLLVDNGSSDNTLGVARHFASHLNLRILEKKDVTIAALRNLGASAARGEFLAFLDADCLPPPRWLQHALELFGENPSVILGAHYSIPVNSSWVARIWYGRQEANVGEVSYVPSGDLLIRKSDFQKLKGFDESIQTNEDYEFCQRARSAGISVRASAGLGVCHLGTPQTFMGFCRKQYWQGTHVFTVFLRSLPRLRNFASVALAFYMLFCMVGLIFGAIPAFISGAYQWPLIFTVAIVLAPLVLSLKYVLSPLRLSHWLPLALLFLAFGVARAICLVRNGRGAYGSV